MAEARIKQTREDREFQDKMQASQTARLVYMQGRIAENPVQPGTCMAFVWGSENENLSEKTEEELMDELDYNLDTWSRVKRDG